MTLWIILSYKKAASKASKHSSFLPFYEYPPITCRHYEGDIPLPKSFLEVIQAKYKAPLFRFLLSFTKDTKPRQTSHVYLEPLKIKYLLCQVLVHLESDCETLKLGISEWLKLQGHELIVRFPVLSWAYCRNQCLNIENIGFWWQRRAYEWLPETPCRCVWISTSAPQMTSWSDFIPGRSLDYYTLPSWLSHQRPIRNS